MRYYKICDLILAIDSEDENLYANYEAFETQAVNDPDILATVSKCKSLADPVGESILNQNIIWSVLPDKQKLNISVKPSSEVIVSMDVNDEWSKADIHFLDNGNEWEWKRTNSLFEILFRNHLVFRKGIVLHASAIEWNGKAIVFTAPAGTGKTTQSNLWKQYMNAKVLNGDRPAIKVVDEQAYVCGTPWSGSSKEYINKDAPLHALVLLEQAPENTIQQLSPIEALTRIMPRFFLPYNDKKMMELASDTIDKILQSTPVYLLKCRPDKGAVDTLYEALI